MRRFLVLFVLVPLAVVIVVLSVANRGDVSLLLDPFAAGAPALSVNAPLFVFLFGALALGVVIGGIAAWIRQGRWRRLARAERAKADAIREENERLRERVAAMAPALPRSPSVRDAA
jgi:uncharacterized integral membrane protein